MGRSHDHHGGRCGGGGEAEPLLAPVELHVVLPHEDIAQDPQGATGRWHIETRETQDALGAGGLEDEICLLQGKILAAQGEREVWQLGAAVHHVLPAHDALGAQLAGDGGDLLHSQ